MSLVSSSSRLRVVDGVALDQPVGELGVGLDRGEERPKGLQLGVLIERVEIGVTLIEVEDVRIRLIHDQLEAERAGLGCAGLGSESFDRQREMADFLRHVRARITPEQVGLAGSGRRRTPGLRREELAALAGISIDWCIRLEQGRAERPSLSVVDTLSSALQLSSDERAHFYALARSEFPPLSSVPDEAIDPSMERVLRSLPESTPAYILGWRWDILAWNRGACDLLIDFAGWWSEHEVKEKTAGIKRFRGPGDKPQLMRFESVLSPTAPDQRLIIYAPADDSPTA